MLYTHTEEDSDNSKNREAPKPAGNVSKEPVNSNSVLAFKHIL